MPGTPRILSVLLAATVLAAGAPAVAAAVAPATAVTRHVAGGPDNGATPPPSEHPDEDTPWT
ncbi:hypothetical protein [Streptomyces sp. ITFR-16]|uniref:hypothetical protein n=1 Tax=Streptomyces sp. ITFR-16 TaxID=3075198 RepID=UPI00288BAB87|nr:hypothetical protein [Streptomyces sp. ITFR-16]WNI21510.1 hypothetical protein RLT58_06000 [Streptomyces sp. ITFR-16]